MSTDRQEPGREKQGLQSQSVTDFTQPPPLFMLPALIDDDPEFDRVWDPIRDTLNIVRLSYLDWTELVKPGVDVADLVSHVSRQIESKAPAGPLLIAGYSIGGCLAYACAFALESAGRTVARLAILDASANMQHAELPLRNRLRDRVRNLSRFNLRGALASVVAKCLTQEPLWPVLRSFSRFRRARLPFHFERYLHEKLTMQMELLLFRSWWPPASRPAALLNAPTFVFRSEDYDGVKREDLGWRDYCAHCNPIRVAGDHGSMLHEDKNGPLLALMIETMTLPEG